MVVAARVVILAMAEILVIPEVVGIKVAVIPVAEAEEVEKQAENLAEAMRVAEDREVILIINPARVEGKEAIRIIHKSPARETIAVAMKGAILEVVVILA